MPIAGKIIALVLFVSSCDISNKDNRIDEKAAIEGIHAAFYNSKGSRIALSTTKGRIILADADLNLLLQNNTSSGNEFSSFFSLDDKHIITGGQDKKLKIWNASTLKLEKEYAFNFNSWTSVQAYTTLGGCGEGGKLVIYNTITSDTLQINLEKSGAFHLYYIDPDTSLVVSSGVSGYEIDLIKRKIVHTYSGHKDLVYCIMPSNKKNKIITASKDSCVRIFDRSTEKCLFTSAKLNGSVYVACFSNDDATIAASTSDGTIYFMDTILRTIKMKIKAFNTRINTIHYSPNGNRILAGSEGGGAKLFSTEDGRLLYELDYSSLE